MKKIYAKGALSMLASGNGFIFPAMQSKMENDYVISYKFHDLVTGNTSLITRSVYLLTKFGNHFDTFEQHLDDFINCKTAQLPNHRIFVTYPDGRAMIFDSNGNKKWNGILKYKGFGPADVAVDGNFIWCTFPENNAVIKYNSASMRHDFIIGGSASGGLNEPHGVFLENQKLIVTSANNGSICAIDLETFHMESIAWLDEPVYQYLKTYNSEIVLSESGIYMLS